MTWFQAVVLGIVQGLTELLPVSSSGHLALVPAVLGWGEPALGFTVAVHVGTAVAVCVYFRRDLAEIITGLWWWASRRAASDDEGARIRAQAATGGWLLMGSVPAAVAGLLLEDVVEAAFGSMACVGAFLIVTACILWIAQRLSRRVEGREAVSWKDALWVGIGQAFALFPGISRSGATIGTGMAIGLAPAAAVRFAFLLSIPVILGGGVLEGLRAFQANLPAEEWLCYLVGAVTAGVSAWGAIVLVFGVVRRGRLSWFGVYCAVVGAAALAASLAGYLPA
jgi:undecaprenyl-diphosphatase